LVKDSKLIEGVQRRATKLVQGIEHWKYENRLAYLWLPRLDMRRVRCDLIDTFKIMNSIYDVHSELFFHLDEDGRRGHEKKLFKKRFRLDVRKYVFSNRVVDRWNQLPEKCIKCSTFNTFKKHISIELELEICYEDGGRYMAKACVDLCHQCL